MIENHDFYIKWPDHPRYNDNIIIEDEDLEVLINKIEMILFTKKGELFGDPEFGADLDFFLHKTKVSAQTVERILKDQFKKYIPEMTNLAYSLKVTISPGTLFDIMLVDINLFKVQINAIFK